MRLAELLHFWSFFSFLPLTPKAWLKTTKDVWDIDMATPVREMLQASSRGDVSLIIITEKNSAKEVETLLGALRGVAVFETGRNGSQLAQVISRARQVRLASWMVVVVVVSDDPALLGAFARRAREGRLLVWATRLVVVTRRAPHRLYPLHQTLALTNSLLLLVDCAAKVKRAATWMALPYQGVALLRVASWTVGSGLDLHQPLFRDKFSKLSGETDLLVAMERNHRHSVVMQPDPAAPGGVRVQFRGFMVTVLEYLAQGLNFSYTFQRPPDGSWGIKKQDGSFTGMVGQVHREEVSFGLGPFAINAARQEGVDFTWPVSFMPVKVFAGRGSLEVDPWGFLLPFAPWVWVLVLVSLLLLSIAAAFFSVKFSEQDFSKEGFAFVSIMLRQSVWVDNGGWRWWERVVLGVWMLMTMVLTRSYEGNLMSLLAVRHMPQPYQTLRDVVDDPAVVMVWEKQGAPMQAVMDATSGIFYEVKASEEQGRLKLLPVYAFATILDEVIGQRKVIIDYDIVLTATQSEHFSRTGRCDLYVGQERILAHPLAMIGQKDSPLVMALNARIISMTEAGLYKYWNAESIPNSSACNQVPTTITVSSSLSLRQCWAMLMLLGGGLAVALATFCMEVVLTGVLRR